MDDLRADRQERAEYAVEVAKQIWTAELDYSLESVKELNAMLGALHDNAEQMGLDRIATMNLGWTFGSYLGEVMLRHEFGELGFEWAEEEDGEPILVCRPKDDSQGFRLQGIRPLTKCVKRLEYGGEDDLVQYYIETLSMAQGA